MAGPAGCLGPQGPVPLPWGPVSLQQASGEAGDRSDRLVAKGGKTASSQLERRWWRETGRSREPPLAAKHAPPVTGSQESAGPPQGTLLSGPLPAGSCWLTGMPACSEPRAQQS
ncbi:hypothetical protein KIL84_016286 [Mauremys mutica]|uniref:Uncharacterized protein n=1 Tax=Mauremys mutica TaxID=74926 RepID=A0A9D4AQL0_9SAUR|nr:hypothetical protein KIL84_016286 [Mauremys mutica]